jgi:hypothetical protein
MEPQKFNITNGTLEAWLSNREDVCFPSHDPQRGEISYPQRYGRIREALIPYHTAVERGALLQSAVDWQKSAQKIIRETFARTTRKSALASLMEIDPLVYLNNHGEGHVQAVIKRASELLIESQCELTAYEGYLLLCGIQFHDVGNVFGRKEHEAASREIMESHCKETIKDNIERISIIRIAMVHGGCWGTERDTISSLKDPRDLFGQPVRKRLLAAILRFADELADDCSRADRVALEQHTMPKESQIYHRYSESLHTVKVEKHEIQLGFEFQSPLAMKPLSKNGKSCFLLDEVYQRTLKMERERRYCMRFMRPHFSIDRIRVEIIIRSSENPLDSDPITYTLEERGYPDQPPYDIKSFDKTLRSGTAERRYLKDQWKLR